MKNNRMEDMKAIVFGLSGDLSTELLALLKSICNAQCDASFEAIRDLPADVIFCGTDTETVQQLKAARPDAPIVVVSRHPEVSGWLDSMEAGAADYCAAPFEKSHVTWILESTARASTIQNGVGPRIAVMQSGD